MLMKDDLMNRINITLINMEILNKRNRNLDSYYVSEKAPPDNNNLSKTRHYNNIRLIFRLRCRINFPGYFTNSIKS